MRTMDEGEDEVEAPRTGSFQCDVKQERAPAPASPRLCQSRPIELYGYL